MFEFLRSCRDAWRRWLDYDDEPPRKREPSSSAVKDLMPRLAEIARALNGINGSLPVGRQNELEVLAGRINVFHNRSLDRADFVRHDQTLVAHLAEVEEKDGSRRLVVSFPVLPSVTDRALFESTPWLNAEIRAGS